MVILAQISRCIYALCDKFLKFREIVDPTHCDKAKDQFSTTF